MTTKLQAQCAVCFRTHKLYGNGNLTRHGFSIVTQGFGHGHEGAWHTGPCGGVNFPHFGISTEGTKWALGQTKAALKHAKAGRKQLDTNPPLTWTPDKWAAKRGVEAAEVEFGTDAQTHVYKSDRPYDTYRVSGYDELHGSAVRAVEANIASLKSQVAFYKKAIKNWESKNATPVAAKPSGHKKSAWKNKSDVSAPLCKQWAMRRPTGTAVYAATDAEVGCKSCLKAMERQAKERAERVAKKAANKTYTVTFPNGSTATTTNDREMTKRSIVCAVIALDGYDKCWRVAKWAVSEESAKTARRRYNNAGGWQNVQIVKVEVQ